MHFLVQNVLLKIKNKDIKIDFNLRTIKMTHVNIFYVDVNIDDSGSILKRFEKAGTVRRFERAMKDIVIMTHFYESCRMKKNS